MKYNEMYESISKNNELENEMTLDMSYFWYSDESLCIMGLQHELLGIKTYLNKFMNAKEG